MSGYDDPGSQVRQAADMDALRTRRIRELDENPRFQELLTSLSASEAPEAPHHWWPWWRHSGPSSHPARALPS